MIRIEQIKMKTSHTKAELKKKGRAHSWRFRRGNHRNGDYQALYRCS